MIDIKQVRENSEIYLKDLEKRKVPDKIKWLKDLVKLDQKWRQVKFDLQKVVHLKKEISMEISEMKKKEEDITLKLKRLRQIPETIEVYEAEMDKMEEKINYYLMRLPNLLHESVPQGDSEEDNEVVNLYGKKPTFDFEPKSHVDLLKELDDKEISLYETGKFIDLCKGPHVKNTKEMGKFKIIKEESVSAGVRRIKAVLE